jgi:hypothetical protein
MANCARQDLIRLSALPQINFFKENMMSTTLTAQTTTTNVSMTTSNDQACCAKAAEPTTSVSAEGTVDFENENYSIKVGDTGEINVTNKQTGEAYRVWGDPHVDVDGKHAFDFKGTTTFDLDDGTKITVETTPWKGGDNGATIASTVTIVDGQSDYAVQINGVDDNKTGDLTYNETSKGWLMDDMVDDGNVLHENPAGTGFVAVDDRGNVQTVDQKWIDQSEADLAKGGNDGANSNQELNKLIDQFAKMINIFTGIMAIRFMGEMLSNMGGSDNSSTNDNRQGNKTAQRGGREDMSFSASESSTSVSWSNNEFSMTQSNRTFDFTMSRKSAFA